MLQREIIGDLWRGSAGIFGTLLAAVSAQYELGVQYFGINPFLKSDISFVMGIIIGGLSIISLLYRIAESRNKVNKTEEKKNIAKDEEDDYYK